MYMQYALNQCTICDVCTHPDVAASARASSGASTSTRASSTGTGARTSSDSTSTRTSTRASDTSTRANSDTSTKDTSSPPLSAPVPSHLRHTLPIHALWRAYAQYKFVFSPWGNGPDCGRSWEIMLAGDSFPLCVCPLVYYSNCGRSWEILLAGDPPF